MRKCDLLLWPQIFCLAQPQLLQAFCVAAVSYRQLPAAISMLTFSRDAVFQSRFDTLTLRLHHWAIHAIVVGQVARDDVTIPFDVTFRSRDVVLMDCFELWISRLRMRRIFRDVIDDVVVVVAVVDAFPHGLLHDDLVLKLENV